MEKLLLRPKEVAEVLNLGRGRVYEMLATGELPSIKLGARILRIPVHALNKWLEAKENGN